MAERGSDVRRQAVLAGCVLAMVGLAMQFAFDLLWPDAAVAALLLVLYLGLKVVGDRLAAVMVPQAPRMRSDQEWLHWLRFAIPVALLQAILVALGVSVARSAAALFPCALFVADLGWLRDDAWPETDADSLGRRLEAWP